MCGAAGEIGHFGGNFVKIFSIPYSWTPQLNAGLGECSLDQNCLNLSNLESDLRYELKNKL